MKTEIRRFIVATLSCVPLAVLAQAGGSPSTQDAGRKTKEMSRSSMSGKDDMKSMPMSGNPDRDFAMMMRKHHESAVKMAREELEKGSDPQMKEMAKKILESQKREIDEFDAWLKRSK